jgi:hypothetical protein
MNKRNETKDPNKKLKAFTFLLSEDLFAKVKKEADENMRAVGQEIRYAVDQYYKGKEQNNG